MTHHDLGRASTDSFDTYYRCAHSFGPRLGDLDATPQQGESERELVYLAELLLADFGNSWTDKSMDFDVSHDSVSSVTGPPTTSCFVGTMDRVGNCSPQHSPYSDGRSALRLVSRSRAPSD